MSAWNPFLPTQRDIDRTEELAKKSSNVAFLLALLFPPIAMIYLNRGVNNLKIIGYTLVISFAVGIVLGISFYDESDKEFNTMAKTIGVVLRVSAFAAHGVESSRAVSLAQKRKSQLI